MSSSSDGAGEVIGILIIIGLVIAAVIYIFIPLVILAIAMGSVFGGGVSLFNYGLSLKNNISLEKPTL